jgi:hypothetical protein
MSGATYSQRKALGQCPGCKAPPQEGRVYCETCGGEKTRQDRQRHLQRTAKRRAIPVEALQAFRARQRLTPLPPIACDPPAGAMLACCSTWEPITQIPHTCPYCQQVYFTTADMAHLAQGV